VLFEKGRVQFTTSARLATNRPAWSRWALAAVINSRWVLGDDRVLFPHRALWKSADNLIMPPMRAFDDETIAGTLTYIRRSWVTMPRPSRWPRVGRSAGGGGEARRVLEPTPILEELIRI